MAVKFFSKQSPETASTIFSTKSMSWIGYYSDCNQCCDRGFSGEDLEWLAHVTVRIQVSEYHLSDYIVRSPDKLEQNTVVHAPITFEEIVIVMINTENKHYCRA